MRILAIETTERIPTVAGVESGRLIDTQSLDPDKRSAQSLAPGMRVFLDSLGWKPSTVDLIAVAVGPGSFTGIRVGVTTAKAFAYAIDAGVLGVSTLEAIALGCPESVNAVSAAVDAQRREVMACPFRRNSEGHFDQIAEPGLQPLDTWLSDVPEGYRLAGPILRKLRPEQLESVPLVDSACWSPKASLVGLLADRKYAQGDRNTIWDLRPVYSRPSAAEEKARKDG